MIRAIRFLLLVPAFALVGVSLLWCWFVLQLLPPFVTWATVVIALVIGAWFVVGRRRSSSILAGSETSLMGRQSSAEGLL